MAAHLPGTSQIAKAYH